MRISTQEAAERLQKGSVVALPTETVYGLAASLYHTEAIEKIFQLKGRPRENPLIVHVASPEEILSFTQTAPLFYEQLAKAFWPGPLTLVLPIREELIPSLVRANLSTAGFRIPNHPLTREVLKKTGPLVMPSANLSGKPSATLAEHVEIDFGGDFPVLDGGSCQQGVESTILVYEEPHWVAGRLGSLPLEAFEELLGYLPEYGHRSPSQQPICPGQKFRHYAPEATLLLQSSYASGFCVLGFIEREYKGAGRIMHMGSLNDPNEVAGNLYRLLRELDQEGIGEAWVDMNFPDDFLWRSIRERLLKAGSK
ncbi:MAG: threonylcarbamoyl-AMP synthase [Parachlamydia sp.]|jgi:L-threonylcarbamoyladenylate synthase|nr:threonylcarbamoyl-AMP synthase [Parachlamydia sp.]